MSSLTPTSNILVPATSSLQTLQHRHIPQNVPTISAALFLASQLGVLLRLSLIEINTYPKTPLPPLAYPEAIGCLIFGFASATRDQLTQRYLPLYLAITTGLAGSVTTFSSWCFLIFRSYALSDDPVPANRIRAAGADIVIIFSLSLAGLLVGQHFGQACIYLLEQRSSRKAEFTRSDPNPRRGSGLSTDQNRIEGGPSATSDAFHSSAVLISNEVNSNIRMKETVPGSPHENRPSSPSTSARDSASQHYDIEPENFQLTNLRGVDWMVIAASLLFWISTASIVLWLSVSPGQEKSDSANWWKGVAWAAMLGPFGTILRWRMSILNKRYIGVWPMGTFLANMLGTAILAALFLLSRMISINGGGVYCRILLALVDGFCGCLTTLSTFMAELIVLPTLYAYRYAAASLLAGQLLFVLLIGPALWSGVGTWVGTTTCI